MSETFAAAGESTPTGIIYERIPTEPPALYNANRDINEIAKALCKAQSEMENAPLNCVNPHFKSKYADLAAIRDAVMPALTKAGIAVFQATGFTSNGFGLSTRLIHGESGQYLESFYPLDPHQPAQKMGSALTYAKRYSLSTMTCIAAEEDDDGNEANKSNGASKSQPPKEAKISIADTRLLRDLIKESEYPHEDYWCSIFKIDKLDDMPASWVDRAIQRVNEKRVESDDEQQAPQSTDI